MRQVLEILPELIRGAWPPAKKTIFWLLKMMIPISLAVRLLQFWGVVDWLAQVFSPLFRYVGLEGNAAIAYITAAVNTTYAGVAVMTGLDLTLRQATIVSLMMLISHALPIESTVNRLTGSSFFQMFVLRIFMAFVAAAYLNWVLPPMNEPFGLLHQESGQSTLTVLLLNWAQSMLKMAVMVAAIIFGLMVLQQFIEKFQLMPKLSHSLRPLMHIFGLPENTAYMWLVGNILGLSYGGAVTKNLIDSGEITKEEANSVNYHLIMNHSLLEDTAVFAAAGISPFWIISTRLLMAMLIVWTRRAFIWIKSYSIP